MDSLSFGDHQFEKFLARLRLRYSERRFLMLKVAIAFFICWLPLGVLSLIYGNFWTGDFNNSFITSFEAQTRFLISLPILIIVEPLINFRLKKTLIQFHDGGLIPEHRVEEFWTLIERKVNFLQNPWTYLGIVVVCYVQVAAIFYFEVNYTSLSSWQLEEVAGEIRLNMVGKWAVFVSRPLTLFFIYRWILRVFVWGRILARISNLDLRLSPFHADKVGGLGFLSFSVSYFAPFTFAVSVALAGNVADLMLIDGMKLADFRMPLLAYVLLMSIFFTYPLFVFARKLVELKEKSVFSMYDQIKYVYHKAEFPPSLGAMSKPMEDDKIAYISSLSDFNSMMDNVFNIRAVPFQVKDLFPLWILTLLPFLFVIMIEIPLSEILSRIVSTLF
jgi:hypothetical protein